MGTSQSEKAASHERIVAIAAARIREEGLDGISVADIMREAGLTHGGFYRHFASRSELVTEALTLALADGSVQSQMTPQTLGTRALPAIIYGYLSRAHRDSPASGCAIAALAQDMSRAAEPDRELYGVQVQEDVDLLASLPPLSDDPESPLAVLMLSALVGALSIARAVEDKHLSQRILRETADGLMALISG